MTRTLGIRPTVLALFPLIFLALAPALSAQNYAGPQPAPLPPPIAAPRDIPFPGTISLLVDLTDVAHRVFNVHETIPVSGHEITLLYPQWVPGAHSPVGPISKMAGLVVTAQGKRIAWVRDRVNVFAFHVTVPAGATSVEVNFQYLAPLQPNEGRISFSSKMADLSWNEALLYPAGYFSRRIEFAPAVRLPAGWKFATALEVGSQAGDVIHFQDTTLNTLVDSPLYAGLYYERLDLSSGPDNRVYLDVFADAPADLAVTPAELQDHRNLVVQAARLFRSHHYSHYDFLFSLSDRLGGEGLEHHQSSEDGTRANYFTNWAAGVGGRDLLAHEYTHSWNGKFRRPYDLWTPNYNVPMQDDLLWVYEGLTEYWGSVLTARAGMRTPEQARDVIAQIASNFEISPGRTWRPLVDTTNQPIISQRSPVGWVSWQRAEDYYMEGLLVWLDADTTIRELSGGKKSLDDFARLFYGIDNGSYVTRTYDFEDIVRALNTVQPYDWAKFLRTRVYDLAPQVPLGGITQGGYRLVYNDTEPAGMGGGRGRFGASFATSLGFNAAPDGTLTVVWWGSPAFKAGMALGMQIEAVDGQAFSVEKLRDAILAAETGQQPIDLLVSRGGRFFTVSLDYHGGLRYPHLERVEGTPDRLDAIIAPLP